MRWFRQKAKEPSPQRGPSGDIVAIQMVRELCQSGYEGIQHTEGCVKGQRPDEQHIGQRYQNAKRRALALARQMEDDLMRDSALREVVSLCMLADDARAAEDILRELGSKVVIEMVLTEHPTIAERFIAIHKNPLETPADLSALNIIRRPQTTGRVWFDNTSLQQFKFKTNEAC